jgi:hypothetical protein
MALMSGDLNRNVRRAVATGASDCAGYYSCIQPGSRGLPSDAIRVVIGEHDHTARPRQADDRGSTPGFRQQLTALTEQPAKCNAKGSFSCFRPNGSGFYIVQDSETAEKHADHRFWQKGEQAAGNRIDSLEPAYVKDSWRPWSLDATIDWLAGKCGNRTCDPTENAQTCALDCGDSHFNSGSSSAPPG